MTDAVNFEGTIVRLEKDGFGIVQFDHALGANTHGVFSTSLSAPGLPFPSLKPKMRVTGTAETSDRDLAMIKTLELAS